MTRHMATHLKRVSLAIAGFLLLATTAPAYYHFVHFASRNGAMVPVPEKFDLDALVDGTVRYYISETGPATLAANDSFASVISQIRAATQVWNDVASSRLRVAFGGLSSANAHHSSAYIDVVFDEVPPGLLALGGPATPKELRSRVSGPFVPITQSVVIFNRDLTNQRSSSEGFFLTVVHEFGHAMGLQHTMSSSVMSTSITRSTTKSRPLDVDDVAGISVLYPTQRFAASTGTITGRVSLSGQGVNLASVVALSPQGSVVSGLTNPDGAYKIEGVPAGQYYVYVHPLPPPVYGEASPANLYLPRNPDDKPLDVGPFFDTQFYPGVKNLETAVSVSVKRGESVEKIDFAVRGRDRLDIYAVTAYSFPGNTPIPQGYLSAGASRQFLVASGFGLITDGAPTKGLKATVVGGSAFVPADSLSAYEPDARYLKINLDLNPFSGAGPRHLLFSLNNDIHVRPSALHLTPSPPPFIDAVAASGDLVAISGRNLSADTRILFDGVSAPITAGTDTGILIVQPPFAEGGFRASIVAVNPDGQSSLFLQGNEPPTWDYGRRDRLTFSVSPSALPAGSESMVEIRGSNTAFRTGQADLGFGSTDVFVRNLWVTGPDSMWANVVVSPDAQGTLPITLVSGLSVTKQPLAFQVQRPSGARITVHPPAVDQASGRVGVYPGRKGFITLTEIPANLRASDLTVTLRDEAVTGLVLDENKLSFQVPASLTVGPAILRIKTSRAEVFPVVISVEAAPPEIAAVYVQANQPLTTSRPVTQGDLVTILVSGLGEAFAVEKLTVNVGGISHSVQELNAVKDRAGFYELKFYVGTTVTPGNQVELTVSLNGRESVPAIIAVAEKH